jgi:nickel/cobalt transporter (NicO) family protein
MRLISLLLLGFLIFSVAPMVVTHVDAQEAVEQKPIVVIDKSKLLGRQRNADGTLIETAFTENPVQWMREKQQRFYASMNASLRQLKAGSSTQAGWTLFVMSFLYGVFHAAGPGHGKAVISGWLLATESELKRGVLIAFMSAIIQALTAILIVSGLLLFFSSAAQLARSTADFLESASYALVGALGLYLIWTGWRRHHHISNNASTVERTHEGPQFELVSRPDSSAAVHVHDENCGHAHAPAASELRGEWSLRRAFAMAFAVGIRPCSGAILVLIFAYPLGLYAVGVASVLAMGVGVFLTIALIAALTVYAKSWAFRVAGADNPFLGLAVKWGKTFAGLAIASFGALMFLGSLGSANLSL